MALIIDTMNVLHAWTVLRTGQADQSVSGLSRLIGTSRYAGRRVRLVCDGPAPADWPDRVELALGASGRVTALYAGGGRDADSLIERLLEEDPGVRHTLVVSSDRRLMKAARRRKAGSLGSAAFLHHLLHDAREAGLPTPDPASRVRSAIPLAASTVEGWLRYFGIGSGVDGKSGGGGGPAGVGARHPAPVERMAAEQREGAERGGGTGRRGARPKDGRGPSPLSDGGSLDAGGSVGGIDPALERLIREAMAEGVRIDPSELDMSRWVE